jgi:hypothetical protein
MHPVLPTAIRALVCLLVGAALNLPSAALAWGASGHEIVSAIAHGELTPAEREKVSELLNAAQLPDFVKVGSWADAYRITHRHTGPWHYVNIPLEATGYDEDRDCHDNGRGQRAKEVTCVVAKIEQFRQQLADKSLPSADRGMALAFLIHFVADLHQPLHASNNNDRGGNDVPATFFGQSTIVYSGKTYPLVLHAVWDTSLIDRLFGANADVDATAKRLQTTVSAQQKKDWCAGGPVNWANETHGLAVTVAYGKLPPDTPKVLDREYFEATAPVVTLQLQRAANRLACVLRGALN